MIALKPMMVKPSDVIKMRSTLKSFKRDWAKEVIIKDKLILLLLQGEEERKMCYQPIIDEIISYFPEPIDKNL